MKVLVVAEGPSELGSSPDTSSLVALAKRMINEENVDYACRKVSDPAVRTHRRQGKHANYEKRALGWVRFAEREEFDALVFLIDQDGHSERETGIENAQSHVHFTLRRAMGNTNHQRKRRGGESLQRRRPARHADVGRH